jgi:glycosyltransferase involved in cell wall biosynthesis
MREQMGIDPDAFVVGMVAANKGYPSRKCFSEALQAFRIFHERHEDAVLYLHTVLDPSWSDGEDIARMLLSLEIPESAVVYPDQYRMKLAPFPDELMAEVYSSFDVLLNPSSGEGFGVPIMEAQACGVPAIVTDFTAMSEVCGAGWKVAPHPRWTPSCSWQAIPDIKEIAEALEAAHSLPSGKKNTLAIQARQHAKQYDVEVVMERDMLPALAEVEERIGGPVEQEAAAA